MDRILSALKREPVRTRLYSLTSLVAAYLVAKNVVAPTDADFIVAVAGLVLVVESARSKVSPVDA